VPTSTYPDPAALDVYAERVAAAAPSLSAGQSDALRAALLPHLTRPRPARCRTAGQTALQPDRAAELIRWGKAYLDLGWRLILLQEDSREPLSGIPWARNMISTHEQLVKRVNAHRGRVNLGVPAGPSNLLIVDVDRGHAAGVDGEATLLNLAQQAGGELPRGPQQLTPSGGRHLVFRAEPGIGAPVGVWPGIDFRGGLSYIVVEPSTRPEGSYRWLISPRIAPPPLPAWLHPPKPKPTPIRRPEAVTSAPADRVLVGLARTVAEAPQGTRNGRLYWASRRLAEHAAARKVPLDVGAAALLDAASAAGLPIDEADRTLRSGLRGLVAS
jgi:hypothetical protein